ncbi:MAG: alpha/beta hydrolase [Dehalococcoidia bacterium]|nr:alpha/beta hydrolase [Dehalococcoidia bacterium]
MGHGVRDEYVMLNGLRFHYREWGDLSAPPLILLHGFTGHARSWDSLAEAFAGSYRVLALDQRGHGESAWADDYSTGAMVSDVAAFVAALGLTSFDLLGLSMGGSNAYHYAAGQPAGLRRLIILDMGPETMSTGSQRISTGVQANDLFDSPEAAIAASRAANPRADEFEVRHRARHNLMRTGDGKWTYRYDKALRSGTPRVRPAPEENWAAWKRIAAPVLVVRGGESDILAAETAQRMVESLPGARLIEIPGSGHSIPLDAPARLRDALKTFL